MIDRSWGLLGKPPQSVIDGTHPYMDLYWRYAKEAAAVMKMPSGKKKTLAMADVRARFLRDFKED